MTPATEAMTKATVEAAVRATLDGRLIRRIAIRADTDRDGLEWLDIDLHYEASDRPLSPRAEMDVLSAVNDALLADGDRRIPYVLHFYDESSTSASLDRAS